jgi:pyridoxamine 5'-phosphate oxidase
MNALYQEAINTFASLFEEAKAAGEPDRTAMIVSSVSEDGRPSARAVLLKDFDERGFVFYTNFHSRKGQEILARPHVALTFLWMHVRNQLQIRIEGKAEQVSEAEADRYFASRHRDSRIGAWASHQSETLDSRQRFEDRIAQYETEFEGRDVTRPPHWSGFRVVPDRIEFWYGAQYRLHERQYFERDANGEWSKRMLYP